MEVPGIPLNSSPTPSDAPGQPNPLYSLVNLVLQEQLKERPERQREMTQRVGACFPAIKESPVCQLVIRVSVGDPSNPALSCLASGSLGRDGLESTVGSAGRQSPSKIPGPGSGLPMWDVQIKPDPDPSTVNPQQIRDDRLQRNPESVSKFDCPPVPRSLQGLPQHPGSPTGFQLPPGNFGWVACPNGQHPWMPSSGFSYPTTNPPIPFVPAPSSIPGLPSPYWRPSWHPTSLAAPYGEGYPTIPRFDQYFGPPFAPVGYSCPVPQAPGPNPPQGAPRPHFQPLDTLESIISPASADSRQVEDHPSALRSLPPETGLANLSEQHLGKKKPLCRSINLSSVSQTLPALTPQDPERVKLVFTRLMSQAHFLKRSAVRNTPNTPPTEPQELRARILLPSTPSCDSSQLQDLPPYCQQLHSFWKRPTPNAPQVFRRRKILKTGSQVIQFDELNLSRRILAKRGHKL